MSPMDKVKYYNSVTKATEKESNINYDNTCTTPSTRPEGYIEPFGPYYEIQPVRSLLQDIALKLNEVIREVNIQNTTLALLEGDVEDLKTFKKNIVKSLNDISQEKTEQLNRTRQDLNEQFRIHTKELEKSYFNFKSDVRDSIKVVEDKLQKFKITVQYDNLFKSP